MVFTNVPLSVASCPECGGQIQAAIDDGGEIEPGSYLSIDPKLGLVACCSLDNEQHRYHGEDWDTVKEQLLHYLMSVD